ncbi:MAG: lysyl oxidase family protein [Pirellulaceae bacterium]
MSYRVRDTAASRRNQPHAGQLEMEALEPLNMLAPVYPDMFAWASESNGYLHDYVIEGDLLRFSTAFANQGDGNLELRGGNETQNGNQEVWQRVFDDQGGYTDHLAGEFTYHPGHGHIHFDGYAIYNLREITPEGGVGDIVASGGKISFCLIDIARYDPNAGPSEYGGCGQVQGVTAGWSDVYGRYLSDQWINISGIADGSYWLEVVVDPDDQILESDETNNVTTIQVDIVGGPGDNGDRWEPNNTFVAATNLGIVAQRQEAAISIHTDTDTDFYQFTALEDGDFEITVEFTHNLGNLDAFIYDANENLVTSGTSLDDLEVLNFSVLAGETFFLQVDGVGADTNGYELDFDGPGNIVTSTVSSTDVPVVIPDGAGSNSPGAPAISTLEGPDITLSDLNLIFDDLDHTWLGDLHFELTSPAGTTAVIITSQWESGGGLLGSQDNFTGTVLDDQAPTNLGDGTAPFTGSFNVEHSNVPNSPLSAFNGESALGTWTVEITDWYSADTGTLRAWSIMFTGIDNNPGDGYEQNDAFPQATELGDLGQTTVTDLSIHVPEDEDFFRFNAEATGIAHVDLSFINANGNLDFYVYDDTLTEIARGDSATDNESASFAVETDGLYYIQVAGYTGDTNDYTLTVDTPTAVFETGEAIGITTEWQTVLFDREFIDPVVILSPVSMIDGDPVTSRIRNVTSTGFEMQLMEWDYQDGAHTTENVGFIVFESGRHLLDNGAVVEAGHETNVSDDYGKVSFEDRFQFSPILITQLEADHANALAPQPVEVHAQGFGVRAVVEENGTPGPAADVHWVAIDRGTGNSDGMQFEAGFVEPATSDLSEHTFQNSFSTTPLVFAFPLTAQEVDPVSVRLDYVNSTMFGIMMQEEQSGDPETTHNKEALGFFAIAPESQGFGGRSASVIDPGAPESQRPDQTFSGQNRPSFDLLRAGDRWMLLQGENENPRLGDNKIVNPEPGKPGYGEQTLSQGQLIGARLDADTVRPEFAWKYDEVTSTWFDGAQEINGEQLKKVDAIMAELMDSWF